MSVGFNTVVHVVTMSVGFNTVVHVGLGLRCTSVSILLFMLFPTQQRLEIANTLMLNLGIANALIFNLGIANTQLFNVGTANTLLFHVGIAYTLISHRSSRTPHPRSERPCIREPARLTLLPLRDFDSSSSSSSSSSHGWPF